jgi:hypothetical protein
MVRPDMSPSRRVRFGIVCFFLGTAEARAGMPSVTLADLRTATRTGLTDLGQQRLEVISFFLLVLIGCAWLVQRVWNSMRKEFPILPRLSFARAVGVIVLWGLLFVLVLTMISGARELMTPGAWEKVGLTYRLVPENPPIAAQITARVESIESLRKRLQSWESGRDKADGPAALPDIWLRVDGVEGGRYIYVPAKPIIRDDRHGFDSDTRIWAYESESVGSERLVLLRDGETQWMPPAEIARCLKAAERALP